MSNAHSPPAKALGVLKRVAMLTAVTRFEAVLWSLAPTSSFLVKTSGDSCVQLLYEEDILDNDIQNGQIVALGTPRSHHASPFP
jgi:hypothetical protein